MSKQIVSTGNAPAAIGSYCQAIKLGDLVFLSGQIPINPESGELVGEDIEAQTKQVLENLGAVLSAAGSGFERVLKTTCFLVDMADFASFNEVYAAYFPSDPPARSTVTVAALPRGARVEIEAVAYFRH